MSDDERANVVRLLDLLAVEVTAGRRDTSLLRGDMQAGFRELRSEFGELRSEFGELRSEFGDLRSRFGGVERRLGNLEIRVEGVEDELRAFRGDVVQRLTRLERSGMSEA